MITALLRLVREDQLLNRHKKRGIDPKADFGTTYVLNSERVAIYIWKGVPGVTEGGGVLWG